MDDRRGGYLGEEMWAVVVSTPGHAFESPGISGI